MFTNVNLPFEQLQKSGRADQSQQPGRLRSRTLSVFILNGTFLIDAEFGFAELCENNKGSF